MPRRSRFVAPRFIQSFAAVQRALQDIQSALDRIGLSRYRRGLEAGNFTAVAGAFMRVRPPSGGQAGVLPRPGPENAGETITIAIEDPQGTLILHAPPGTEINGASTASFTVAGVVELHSNGVSAWTGVAQLPSESPAEQGGPRTAFGVPGTATAPRADMAAGNDQFLGTSGTGALGFRAVHNAALASDVTWANVLARGAVTGGNGDNPTVSQGDTLRFDTAGNGSYPGGGNILVSGTFEIATLSGDLVLDCNGTNQDVHISTATGDATLQAGGFGKTIDLIASAGYVDVTAGLDFDVDASRFVQLDSGSTMTLTSQGVIQAVGATGLQFTAGTGGNLFTSTVGDCTFRTGSGAGAVQRLRIKDDGEWEVGDDVTGTAGQVIVNQGADTSPEWETLSIADVSSDFDWAGVLAHDPATDGNDPEISQGDQLLFDVAGDGDYTGLTGQLLANGSWSAHVDGNMSMTSINTVTVAGSTINLNPTTDGKVNLGQGFLQFAEKSASTPSMLSGFALFWVKDDAPNVPMFTDDTDVDHELGYGKHRRSVDSSGGAISALDWSSTDVWVFTASATISGNTGMRSGAEGVIIAGSGVTVTLTHSSTLHCPGSKDLVITEREAVRLWRDSSTGTIYRCSGVAYPTFDASTPGVVPASSDSAEEYLAGDGTWGDIPLAALEDGDGTEGDTIMSDGAEFAATSPADAVRLLTQGGANTSVYDEDFLGASSAARARWTATDVTAARANLTDNGSWGVVQLIRSVSSDDGLWFLGDNIGTDADFKFEDIRYACFLVEIEDDVTELGLHIGFVDGDSWGSGVIGPATTDEAMWFRYQATSESGSGEWGGAHRRASSTSVADSGTSVAADTMYKLEITHNGTGTYRWYLNGSLFRTVASTFPSGRCVPFVLINNESASDSKTVFVDRVTIVQQVAQRED